MPIAVVSAPESSAQYHDALRRSRARSSTSFNNGRTSLLTELHELALEPGLILDRMGAESR